MQEISEQEYVVRNIDVVPCPTCGRIHDHITRKCEKVGFKLEEAVQFAGRDGIWEQAPEGAVTVGFHREAGRIF